MKTLILLPLTPLSRRKRENCRQPVGERRFPLPGGEGQGEGRCIARFLNDSAAHASSRTSKACGKRPLSAGFGNWIDKSPFFGLNMLKMATELTKSVTNKGDSVTKLLNFVPNQGNFTTNKPLFTTKQHCFATELPLFATNKPLFATKQHCFATELPLFTTNKPKSKPELTKSEAFITPKIAKNGMLEAEKVKKRQFLGAVFTQPLVTNNNVVIESFNILPLINRQANELPGITKPFQPPRRHERQEKPMKKFFLKKTRSAGCEVTSARFITSPPAIPFPKKLGVLGVLGGWPCLDVLGALAIKFP